MGWRGFALPRLQKHFSPTIAVVILGLVHLFWHLPTYWLGTGIHNVPLVYIFLFILPWTMLFNWLYNRSNGSLIFAVSFHAITNASLSLFRFLPSERDVPIDTSLLTKLSLPAELGGPYLSVMAVYTIVAFTIWGLDGYKRKNTDLP